MKTKILIIIAVVSTLFSGCKNIDPGARVMLIGDSWAQLMCINGSFSDALKKLGKAQTGINCQGTTLVGTTAEYWSNSGRLKAVAGAMLVSKNLETIYISLGGNDLLGFWNRNTTEQEEKQQFAVIQANILKVVDFIHALRPNVKIVLSSYDYVNFQYFLKNQTVQSYVDIYNRMGQPTAEELNNASARLEKVKAEIALKRPNVMYVNNMGLMQYYYGQSDFGVAPQSTPLPGQAPSFDPFMGGRPDLPGPHEAFAAISQINVTDPYHLNKAAYLLFAQNILKTIGY